MEAHAPGARPLLTAEVLSIGSELTVGDTRDTNAGELARSLTDLGLAVSRLSALPDRLADVRDAIADGLTRSDLVITTGGLGPTPDDLTREAIAAALGEEPAVDPDLERWLRRLFERRHLPFPAANLKQAWLIPSATAIPNPHGTAPGWFVETPRGSVIVALPGPPREMRPLWHDWVVPRLRERGVGRREVRRTYRLAGVGESAVADMLGEALLRSTNPLVATYARVEAVDVRIAATDEPAGDGRPGRGAEELFADAEAAVLAAVGRFVWGHGEETWRDAIGAELDRPGWKLSIVEIGTAGALTTLLGEGPWLRFGEVLAPDAPAGAGVPASEADLPALADRVRQAGQSEVGIALRAMPRLDDTRVEVAVSTPTGTHTERRTAFLRGGQAQLRAAVAGASVLFDALRDRREAGTGHQERAVGEEPRAAVAPAEPSAASQEGGAR